MAASLKASLSVGYGERGERLGEGRTEGSRTYVSVGCPRNILGAGTVLDCEDALSDHLTSIGACDAKG